MGYTMWMKACVALTLALVATTSCADTDKDDGTPQPACPNGNCNSAGDGAGDNGSGDCQRLGGQRHLPTRLLAGHLHEPQGHLWRRVPRRLRRGRARLPERPPLRARVCLRPRQTRRHDHLHAGRLRTSSSSSRRCVASLGHSAANNALSAPRAATAVSAVPIRLAGKAAARATWTTTATSWGNARPAGTSARSELALTGSPIEPTAVAESGSESSRSRRRHGVIPDATFGTFWRSASTEPPPNPRAPPRSHPLLHWRGPASAEQVIELSGADARAPPAQRHRASRAPLYTAIVDCPS